VFLIPSPIENGFDVAAEGGKTYLRVISEGRPMHAVPQTAADLRILAALLLNAADVLDPESDNRRGESRG
jgi:hypothetical protein